MSLPPTISSKMLPRYSIGGIFFVASPCDSIEMRSFPGSSFTRSFHSRVNVARQSCIASHRSSLLLMMPPPGIAVAASDQKVSLWRSSNGKSNSVASIWVVSSIETRSTQSNSSPIGRSSSMAAARCRMSPSRDFRLEGATTPCTTRRCSSCLGGSIEIKEGTVNSSKESTIPIVGSDE